MGKLGIPCPAERVDQISADNSKIVNVRVHQSARTIIKTSFQIRPNTRYAGHCVAVCGKIIAAHVWRM